MSKYVLIYNLYYIILISLKYNLLAEDKQDFTIKFSKMDLCNSFTLENLKLRH